MAAVKDQALAASGMERIAAGRGLTGAEESYRGTPIAVADWPRPGPCWRTC